MSEVINTNVFESSKKFVDLTGLDYFWEKAKAYVDGVDAALTGRLDAHDDKFEEVDGKFTDIYETLSGLTGGAEGSIGAMIESAIDELAAEVANTYETKANVESAVSTAKSEAISDAKDYVDEKDSAMKAYVDGKDSAMNSRVAELEAIDHQGLIDAAFNDFATKVSDDKVVNTYKELIDYAAEHGAEFTELVGVVNDKADLSAVNDLIAGAKTYAEEKASAAESAANSYTDVKDSAMKTYVDGKASTAESNANSYTDGKVQTINGNIESLTTEVAKKANSADVADSVSALEAAIAAAKAAAIKDADDKLALKANSADVYTKTEVDGFLETNSAADQAYAKAYTDALFESVNFAETTDIDAIFAVSAE